MKPKAAVRSMTGAGRARGDSSIGELTVELRSVNGRSLALKARLASELVSLERNVEKLCRSRLERGSVSVQIRVERGARALDAAFDDEAFGAAAARLRTLAERYGLAAVTTRDVLAIPGVLRSQSAAVPDALWAELEPLVQTALTQLIEERATEGAATAAAMLGFVDDLDAARLRVAERAPKLVDENRERLLSRLEEFLDKRGLQISADEVVREVALFADRVDVSEELQRLETHVARVRSLLESGGVLGRQLEFLLQEVLREVNTIGSKSPDVAISHDVVAMKSAVDKLKEQAANLE